MLQCLSSREYLLLLRIYTLTCSFFYVLTGGGPKLQWIACPCLAYDIGYYGKILAHGTKEEIKMLLRGEILAILNDCR